MAVLAISIFLSVCVTCWTALKCFDMYVKNRYEDGEDGDDA